MSSGSRRAPANRARKPSRSRPVLWYRRPAVLVLAVPVVLLGLAAVGLLAYGVTAVPLPESVGAGPTVVRDAGGMEIGTLQPEARREEVALSALPVHVPKAVLAAEDAGFYQHRGVSLVGIGRAALRNLRSGEVEQGGSTITQQYIKNVTADHRQSLPRKLREAVLAVKLERRFNKDEILEFYLNSIYFGRGAYGIEAAAQAYFGKPAVELSQPEAVQLAGIIPAPSRYDPAEHPQLAAERYDYVVGRLVELGWVESVAAEALRGARPQVLPPVTATRFPAAPFFLQLVERELGARLGEDRIYTGLEVTTTLDLKVQERAVAAYAQGFPGIGPSGALVALDPGTGGVRALVGGKDYAADQLNLALAPRQPGSTFKPFALAAWVEEGFSPESLFPAPAERVFEVDGAPWAVRNYGGRGYAPMTLRQATWRSVNTVYADLVVRLGPQRLADVATRAGIGRSLDPDPSLVLGTAEVSPLELAEAYNTLAAGGVHRRAFTVAQARRGERVLYRAPLRLEQALPEQVARMVTDVLRGVIESGTGRAADIGRPAAGKTGTTDNYGDAWFAGYTPALTAVVWMGDRDTNASMPGEPTGGGLPARVWGAFMRAALAEVPVSDFPEPEGELEVVRPGPTAPPSCPAGQARPSDKPGAPCVAVTPTAAPSESPGAEVEPSATLGPSPSATGQPAPAPTLTRAPEPTPAGATVPPPEKRDEDRAAQPGATRGGRRTGRAPVRARPPPRGAPASPVATGRTPR